MKIAIFSDSHGNLANLKKSISWIKKENVENLLHCGDLDNFEALKTIFENFPGKIYITLGNADEGHRLEEKVESLKSSRIQIERNFGEIEIENKKIAFCHSPKIAENLAKTQKYDFIFYGHLHTPDEKRIGKTKLINPGNLAGMFFKATFVIYDTKENKLELKILERL